MRQTRALLWLLLCGALSFPAVAPAEQLYVAGGASNSISGFSIGSDGALSPIACAEEGCATGAGTEPTTLTISPNGKFLFAANGAAESVSTFAIGANGGLSKVECANSHCSTGSHAAGMAITPGGHYLYVANAGKDTITIFSVDSSGALTKVACKPKSYCEVAGYPAGLAVSANGQYLYATTATSAIKPEGGVVSAFSIGSDGRLTPVACSECETGSRPRGITVSPDGQYLYVANRGPEPEHSAKGRGSVSAFQIGAQGALTPIACPESVCATVGELVGATVSPNGEHLYVSNAEAGTLSAFAIGAGGTLSPVECSGCKTESPLQGLAVSPGGKFLYAASAGSATISPFSIEPQGALSPLACTPPSCEAASAPLFQSLAITPDQAPTASFTDTPATAGSPSTFDASASTASPEESVAEYDWSFGDGTSAQSTSPTISHTYATAGPYTVALTVTDSAGCSTQPIFTGQTSSCNGSSSAEQTTKLTIPVVSIPSLKLPTITPKAKLPLGSLFGRTSVTPVPLRLTLSNLRETAGTWRESTALAHVSARTKGPPIGTSFSFELNETATVTLTFSRSVGGRRVGKKCVAPSKRNERARHCTRMVIAGTLKLAAERGLTTVRFYGRLSKYKKLSPGAYTLAARATSASGQHASASALHLTILKSAG
jgi:6-phosphogluconolactonase (cycloisomerase 2 family)